MRYKTWVVVSLWVPVVGLMACSEEPKEAASDGASAEPITDPSEGGDDKAST